MAVNEAISDYSTTAASNTPAGTATVGPDLDDHLRDIKKNVRTLSDSSAPLASPTFTGTVTVPTPSNSTDAATKAYADSIAQGLDIKNSVRVASTANIAIASALVNASTIDGVSVATGDRVLLKDQTAGSENGIYIVAASGAASRATDADSSEKVTGGMYVFVSEGTVSSDMGYVLTTNDAITLGTTALVFSQFSGAGQITAGNGLSKSGNTLTINTAITADLATAQTFTNKRITPRVYTTTTLTTLTPEIDTYDIFHLTALASALTIANPSTSTPTDGEQMRIRLLDNATARALTFGTAYVAKGGVALPTTTTLSKNIEMGFEYNSNLAKWNLLAVALEA